MSRSSCDTVACAEVAFGKRHRNSCMSHDLIVCVYVCVVQETLSELVRLLEEKSAKTEILRFLTFRLDFNE